MNKSETTDVEKEIFPLGQRSIEADEEIRILREVHEFLQEFHIAGKFGHKWSVVLDSIGIVTNSLIAKNDAIKENEKKILTKFGL